MAMSLCQIKIRRVISGETGQRVRVCSNLETVTCTNILRWFRNPNLPMAINHTVANRSVVLKQVNAQCSDRRAVTPDGIARVHVQERREHFPDAAILHTRFRAALTRSFCFACHLRSGKEFRTLTLQVCGGLGVAPYTHFSDDCMTSVMSVWVWMCCCSMNHHVAAVHAAIKARAQ